MVTFNAPVSGVGYLHVVGDATLNGGSITTVGEQTYSSVVTLGTNHRQVTLDASKFIFDEIRSSNDTTDLIISTDLRTDLGLIDLSGPNPNPENLANPYGDFTLITKSADPLGSFTQKANGYFRILGFSNFVAKTSPDQIAKLNNPSNYFGKAVSFKQIQGDPGSWKEVTVQSADDLYLGTSTVSGDFNITSVNGSVYQEAESTLTIGGVLNLEADNAEITASQDLTLGAVDLTGDLTLKVSGDIKQSLADEIHVVGKAKLEAANIQLVNKDNILGDEVTVKTGTLKLTVNGPLTLDQVQVTGQADINSTGTLNLGTGTYGGKLKANSGGSDIIQSGPIKFVGDVDFDAGNAKIDLFDPNNLWTGALTFKGGIIMINHPMLMNAVSAATLVVRVETTIQTAGKTGGASNVTPANEAKVSAKTDISVSTVRQASSNESGLITVGLSAEAAAPGRSFSIDMAEHIPSPSAANADVKVTQMDGKPLPDWLKFDSATKSFVATNVPAGAFPLQLRVGVGATDAVIVIQQNQEVK
jgi:hypothetical protein